MFAFVEEAKTTLVEITNDTKGCGCKTFTDTDLTLLCEHLIAFDDLKEPPQLTINSDQKMCRVLTEYLFTLGWYVENRWLYPSLDSPTRLDPMHEDKELDLGIGEDTTTKSPKLATPDVSEGHGDHAPVNTDDLAVEMVHYKCPKCGEEVDVEKDELSDWKLNHITTERHLSATNNLPKTAKSVDTTSDPEGESNEGDDPTPNKPPKKTPVPKPRMMSTKCAWCGEKIERELAVDLARALDDHHKICPNRPKEQDASKISTTEKKNKNMEEIKTYTHPNGTPFETAEALLNYAEKQNATQTPQVSVRRVRHKAMIKGISPQLQEIGRIAVGEKGGRSKSGKALLPTKLDHFIFTTLDKDDEDRYIRDVGMMEMFGDNCTEIPIRLLYNDIELNFPTFYAKYARSGKKLRGDGENWTVYNADGTREEVSDPNNEHGFLDDKDVKPHGILTVLVEGQNSVGGVFKFRTTSWNSINNILSSLALIKNMCGMLTYIPLKLVYRKKEVTPVGMGHKTWIPVVSVEFRGSIEELQAQASEVQRLTTGVQREEMEQIEAAVRDHLDEDESADEQKDIAAEFNPEVR
jgi:DNA-directed RNA polymerase subunit RPC12/RpoP